MEPQAYRPQHRRIRGRHSLRSLGKWLPLIALGVLVVAAGIGRGVTAPAVAAPGSFDGHAPAALVRDTVPAVNPLPSVLLPHQAKALEARRATRPVPRVAPGSDLIIDEYFVHIPPAIDERLTVVVALHGMGGDGHVFCQAILSRSDAERRVVVAPTFAYGDWRDPNQVAREESSRFIPRLQAFLQQLGERTGLDLDPRVDFYGYSRGAQLAQRFAMVYPEQTHAVALLAAGTYTLPQNAAEVNGARVALRYPFGTADLQERFGRSFNSVGFGAIPFWVGVGGNDRNPNDVPRQWDAYLGDNRVARAEAFVRRLSEAGTPVQLAVIPNADHALTDEMRTRALDFLAATPR